MSIFHDPLFQAVFNTALPIIILSANAPDFPLLSSNALANSLLEINTGDKVIAIDDFLESYLVEAGSKALLHAALQESLDSRTKSTVILAAKASVQVNIIPVTNNNEEINHLMVTVEPLNQTQEELKVANGALEQSVAERTQRLSDTINNLPAGVCILKGTDLVLEEVNDGMLRLWGRDRSITGKRLLDFMPELIGQAFPAILANIFIDGKPHIEKDALVELQTATGNKAVYMDYSYTPLINQEGLVDSILVHADDVSERAVARIREQQLYEELSVTNEELTASNEELEATNNILSDSQQILRASEEQMRFMFNAIPQQVWTASAEGKPTYANHIMCDDLGLSMDVIVQKGWRQNVHPDDLLPTLEKWEDALRNYKPFTAEIRLRFKDNQYVWHLMSVVPMLENDEVKFWIGTNTNIKLQKANEEKKDEFLSIASHELKTPLTNIKAFNQLISRTEDKIKIQGFTKRSADHIGKLEWLINDLLDVTKINAGKMVYNMQEFDFRNLLLNSINSIQETTDTHQIELIGDAEISYKGDPFRLEQVVQNFLSNAVKYSPKAEKVVVNYQLDHENIIVSIQDFGIGIAQKNFNQLFDRYYRVDNTSMRFEGLGLGLYISSEILKRHQGSFWIESEENTGTTFYFRLPLDSSKFSRHEINLHEYYQNDEVTMAYNAEAQQLDVFWKGYQDLGTVQHGCLKMLEMLSRHKVSKVINDNRDVLGTWSDASDWVGKVWFPLMYKAGLRKFAWIYSMATFSQLSAKKSVEVGVMKVDIEFFTVMEAAQEWLDLDS